MTVRRIILVGAAIPLVLLGGWLGRAALSYYADVSICFSPLKIVSHQDRIDAAVRKAQDPKYLTIVRKGPFWHGGREERIYGEAAYRHFVTLDPRACCRVTRNAVVGEAGAITFASTLLHEMSHAVDMGIPKDPYNSHYYIPTNICGLAVSYKL